MRPYTDLCRDGADERRELETCVWSPISPLHWHNPKASWALGAAEFHSAVVLSHSYPPRLLFLFASPVILMKFDFPPDLPISLRHAELLSTLQQHQVVIIAGETGSGKTTQLPKICLQAGWGEDRKSVV